MRSHRGVLLLAAVTLLAAGCQRADKSDKAGDKAGDGKAAGTGSGKTGGPAGKTGGGGPVADIDSKDILARTDTVAEADVKHVLLGWSDLAGVYGPRMDPRAAGRDNAAAAKLAKELLAKLVADPGAIDALVKEHSEDPGSLRGEPYTVKADSPFVPEFKQMALRLREREAGIVKTQFGYHVMLRVPPPPPDPLASNDILARTPGTGTVQVQHVLIGWKGVPAARPDQDPRAAARDKAAADREAKAIFDRARAGEDMARLMKEFSEDPGSKDNGRAYDVGPTSQMVPTFKDLALRLEVNEVGMVVSPFGWHVIKRIPPPPPDKLESADILARAPVTESAKVKHILLGWSELNAGDERGQKRTRPELDALVKKTLARIKKGEKFEALMKELSEDPGSAASGTSYDVAPAANLVQPFKDLGLRLEVGESGVVKSQFGMHIIQRVE